MYRFQYRCRSHFVFDFAVRICYRLHIGEAMQASNGWIGFWGTETDWNIDFLTSGTRFTLRICLSLSLAAASPKVRVTLSSVFLNSCTIGPSESMFMRESILSTEISVFCTPLLSQATSEGRMSGRVIG